MKETKTRLPVVVSGEVVVVVVIVKLMPAFEVDYAR